MLPRYYIRGSLRTGKDKMSLKFERFLYKKRPGVLSFRHSSKPPEPRPDLFDIYAVQGSETSNGEARPDKRRREDENDDGIISIEEKTNYNDSAKFPRLDNDARTVESENEDDGTSEFSTLQLMFPDYKPEKIQKVLASCGSLDEAALALSSSGKTRPRKVKRVKKAEIFNESEDSSIESEASVESDEDEDEGDLAVLSFFDAASVEELALVPSCSEKKATKLTELRPFQNWHDMFHKFHQAKLHYHKLIDGAKELLKEREMLDRLINECGKMSHKINSCLEDLGLEITAPCSNKKLLHPKLLNPRMQLKGYQLVGLNWLITLHEQGVNGILADQMGLGKTAQALAFIAYLIETGAEGPHAIIVPSSTADNWIRELGMWVPGVTYEYYTGIQTERSELRADILGREDKPNIIVASYATAISTPEDRKFFRKLGCHYLILDEGHMVKNFRSLRYQHLQGLRAERKLLLTGTPLQNNLVELISLLNFVMPNIFEQRFDGMRLLLSSDSKGNTVSKYESEKIEQVKKVIEPFILRRLKEDVLQDLPKKVERLIYCDVTADQDRLYKKLLIDLKTNSEEKASLGMNAMMELRKAACHPLLCRQHYDDTMLEKITRDFCAAPENSESTHEYVFEDLTVMSDFEIHKLCQEHSYLAKHALKENKIFHSAKFKFLSKKLEELHGEGSRCLVFSQFTMMLDILEPFLTMKGFHFLRLDGQTPVSERQTLIDRFNNDASILVFLLSTKAGGMGINLTSANTVILHDIDYNPYNDKQAEDRCHRVGQTRDVTVYKLICRGTIEEGIHQCAEDKLRLGRDIAGVDEADVKENVLKWILQSVKR